MARVDVVFDGQNRGALAAARGTKEAIAGVGTEAKVVRRELNGVEAGIGRSARGALAGSGAFRALGRSVAFASATFLGAAGFVHVVKTGIDAAEELSIQLERSRKLFGTHATAVDAWSRTTSRAIGLARDQSLKYANDLGTMLRGMDIAPGKAASMSKALVELAANLAALHHADPAEVLNALEAALAGRTRGLKQYGIFLEAATIKEEAMRLGLVHGKEALTPADRALAIYTLTLQKTTDAHGAYAAKAKTVGGEMKTLRAEGRDLERVLGEALIPTITTLVTHITDWLRKGDNLERVQRDIRVAVHDVTEVVKTAWDWTSRIAKAVGGWKHALELLLALKVVSWLTPIIGSVGKLIGVAGGGGLLGAGGAAEGLLGKLKLLGARVWPIAVTLTILEVLKQTGALKGIDSSKWLVNLGRGVWQDKTTGKFFANNQEITAAEAAKLLGKPVSQLTGGSTASQPGQSPFGGTGGLTTTPTGSIAIPSSFTPTHDTAGLPNFPAIDIMAAPGTKILAPEDGTIMDPHFIPWDIQKRIGGWTIYFLGHQTGNTYFMTHLATAGGAGQYRKGAVIGTIAAVPGNAWGAHVHVGEHQGAYIPGGAGSTPPAPPTGPGRTTGGVTTDPSLSGSPTTTPTPRPRVPRIGTSTSAFTANFAAYTDAIERIQKGVAARLSAADEAAGRQVAARNKLLAAVHAYMQRLKVALAEGRGEQGLAKQGLGALAGLPEDTKIEIQDRWGRSIELSLAQIRERIGKAQERLSAAMATGNVKAIRKASKALENALSSYIPAAVQAGEQAAQQQLEERRSLFEAAFSKLADRIMGAFDRETQRHLQSLQAQLADQVAAMQQAFQAQLGEMQRQSASRIESMQHAFTARITKLQKAFQTRIAALQKETQARLAEMQKAAQAEIDAIEQAGRALTPAEAELQAMQQAHDAAAAAQDLADAQAALAAAQAGDDPQAIIDAQRRIDDLLYQQQVADLEKRAEAERKALDEQTAAQVAALQEQEAKREQDYQDQQAALEQALQEQEAAREQALQDQEARLEKAMADQEAALEQALADQEAAREKSLQDQAAIDQQNYEDQRAAQRDALTVQLADWQSHLEDQSATWSDFAAWLQGEAAGGAFAAGDVPDPVAAMADAGQKQGAAFADAYIDELNRAYDAWLGFQYATGGSSGAVSQNYVANPQATLGYQHGGRARRVRGSYVGREDTILARFTPGETVIDRHLSRALDAALASGTFGGAPVVHIHNPTFLGGTERQVYDALGRAVQPGIDRVIRYRMPS